MTGLPHFGSICLICARFLEYLSGIGRPMHHFKRQVDRGIEAQDGDSPRGLLKAVRASAIGSGDEERVYNSGHESILATCQAAYGSSTPTSGTPVIPI